MAETLAGRSAGIVDERLTKQAIDVRWNDGGRGRARLWGAGEIHAVDKLVQDGRERVHVAALVALACSLLRGAIAEVLGRVAAQLDLGRAVVEELDLVTRIDNDPRRCQRPVGNPGGGVGGLQNGGDPFAESQRALPRQAPSCAYRRSRLR